MNQTPIGILGAHGFIGKHVSQYLKEKQIKTVTFEGDVLDKKDLETFFSTHGIQTAIFLIGSFDLPFENQLKTNTLTLQNFLDFGVTKGLKKIIFSSTGAVYGEPQNGESKETDPLLPKTSYGLSKLFAEHTIFYYANNNSLQYIILRFPNVYGEGHSKGVIHNFLTDIQNKGEIVVMGDGTATRNFIHVRDVCLALEKALEYEKSDIFNIASPIQYSINEVVELLKKRFNFKINHAPSNNNLQSLLLNIEKAKKILGFEPSVVELSI